MLRSINSLRGYTIRATEGEIGKIDDFLFDDQTWVIRYFVVETGRWLATQKILLLPAKLKAIDEAAERVTVRITRQQIENSPPLAADKPVSRQKEAELHRYFEEPVYWGLGPVSAYPIPEQVRRSTEEETEQTEEASSQNDPHLRSTKEVTGYHIQARDGQIGHVEDYLVDDATWDIHYMVVDTRNWLPGKNVRVSPTWIEQVDWLMREIKIDLKRETIKHSPESNAANTP